MSQVHSEEGGPSGPDDDGIASSFIAQITNSPEALQSFTRAVMPTLLASLEQMAAENTRAGGAVENGRATTSHEDPLRDHVRQNDAPGEVGQNSGRGQLNSSSTAEGEDSHDDEDRTRGSSTGNAAQAPQHVSNTAQYPGNTVQYPGSAAQYPGNAAQYPGSAAQYLGNAAQTCYPGSAVHLTPIPGNHPYPSQFGNPMGDFQGGAASGGLPIYPPQGVWHNLQTQACWPNMWPQWPLTPSGYRYNPGELTVRPYTSHSSEQSVSTHPPSPTVGPTSQPLPSTTGESDEDHIDLFLSEGEREDLLDPGDEEEDEDKGPPPAKRRYVPGESTTKLLRIATGKPLKNERRKSILAKYPVPSCDPAHPPKLDDSVACIIPQQARTYDRYLSKMQQFSMDALVPLTWLHNHLTSGEEVDHARVKEGLQYSISLLGNAAAHFSEDRRLALIKHLNKDLKPLAKGSFPNRGAFLFGKDFGAAAKTTVDCIKALKGLQPKKSKQGFYGGGDQNKGKGKLPQPQGRRTNWGISLAPRPQGIFNRLGPATTP